MNSKLIRAIKVLGECENFMSMSRLENITVPFIIDEIESIRKKITLIKQDLLQEAIITDCAINLESEVLLISSRVADIVDYAKTLPQTIDSKTL